MSRAGKVSKNSFIVWADEPVSEFLNEDADGGDALSIHFRHLIKQECDAPSDVICWLPGGPGAGWGLWAWRVRSSSIEFSSVVKEGLFRIAVKRALSHIQPGDGACLSWCRAGYNSEDARFFDFRVGYLY